MSAAPARLLGGPVSLGGCRGQKPAVLVPVCPHARRPGRGEGPLAGRFSLEGSGALNAVDTQVTKVPAG